MQNALTPLDRVVRQYRRDVNQLAAAASSDTLGALETHLGHRLPPGLKNFLERHNGAALLRGSLRLRAASDIAMASEAASQVVLFADGAETQWAYAPDAAGMVFGSWDGERLDPLHGSFSGWLQGTLAVLESQVRDPSDLAAIRFEADPGDVHQLIRYGRSALEAGKPEEAEAVLRRVTVNDPSRVLGWQYLGDALVSSDRTEARQAWLAAFRRTEFPLRWPGAPCLDSEVVRSLERAFTDPEAWEEELVRFLDERVADVNTDAAAEVVITAGRALAESRVRRGKRRAARSALASLVSRCHGFRAQPQPWSAVLELARLEVELGSHDEAEALLRRVRRFAPDGFKAKGLVLLCSIATTRQEPWAEDILREVQAHRLDEVDQVRCLVLGVERALRSDQLERAVEQLEKAEIMARRVALPALSAQVWLATGDVHRAHDRWEEAIEAWSTGSAQLGRRAEAELVNRFRVRFGDAAVFSGDLQEAENHFTAAASGFRDHELVVREAWALLRLARVRRLCGRAADDVLRAALARFKEADLAAGVAAHDAVLGDPGAHLDWHLLRARDHARARYDAQRARPPYDRADADRPERRLGAHRLAIAACSDGVVDHLERRLDAGTRAIETGRLAPKDESVLHYVGAADLLSGHRSWAASEVLLKHLMEQRVDGHAWRALQGAIARSPNAALVHGLLEHIEVPQGKPSAALAAAAELLGLRGEKHAVAPMMKLAQRPFSPKVRKAAVRALGRIGDRRALEVIAASLEEPSLAEAAALALLLLGDRRGLDFHGRALIDRRSDLTGLPGEVVGRYGGPDHLLLLIGAADADGPIALGALQGLGLMGDTRAVPILLDALSRRDLSVVEVASGALELITGHHEDAEPGYRSRWHAWWDTHAAGLPEGVRHREGRVFGVEFLLERMTFDDPWVRRTAYDELCITTGERLPFDTDGPWRLQQAHIRGWRRWWVGARSRFVAGGWYLDGKKI